MAKKAVYYIRQVLSVLIILLGVAVLFPVCRSLPKPFKVTEEAVQRHNIVQLMNMAKIITEKEPGHQNIAWSKERFTEKLKATYGDFYLAEEPGGAPFNVHDKPYGEFQLVITGNRVDKFGMVWGLSADGQILKFFPPSDAPARRGAH
jgi:hypothetical protein